MTLTGWAGESTQSGHFALQHQAATECEADCIASGVSTLASVLSLRSIDLRPAGAGLVHISGTGGRYGV